eukprot:TRINITY_DN11421_c0_g1_i2.p1 TRINITY_DN11421_c0_g1~~TRINITY_DN11421_c0_g1_i2.p1  ORF type:complete len:186 (+),score=4.46 TRINITY_DN11421_c0_g1_i2:73-630(+)
MDKLAIPVSTEAISLQTTSNPSPTPPLPDLFIPPQPTEQSAVEMHGKLDRSKGDQSLVTVLAGTCNLPCPGPPYSNLSESVGIVGQSTFPMGIPVSNVNHPGPGEIYPARSFKRVPTKTVCYRCFRQIITAVEHKATATTYVIMGILFCTVCPLVVVPLCYNDCKLTTHKCPSCHVILYEMPACT